MQKFAAVHASVRNLFKQERSLFSRPHYKANRAAACAEWRGLCAAQGTASLSLPMLVRIGLTAPCHAEVRCRASCFQRFKELSRHPNHLGIVRKT
jgi:hypothetical protein